MKRREANERRLRDLSFLALRPTLAVPNDLERGRAEFPRPPLPVEGCVKCQVDVKWVGGLDARTVLSRFANCAPWRTICS